MHDDSVLVAVDAALRPPAFCACGDNLTISVRDDVVWLECVRFSEPTRLPAAVASFVRGLLHDRRFVIDLPATESGSPVPAAVPGDRRSVPVLR
jgi:hypothetical protein